MTFKECFMTTGHQKQDNDLEKDDKITRLQDYKLFFLANDH